MQRTNFRQPFIARAKTGISPKIFTFVIRLSSSHLSTLTCVYFRSHKFSKFIHYKSSPSFPARFTHTGFRIACICIRVTRLLLYDGLDHVLSVYLGLVVVYLNGLIT